MRQFYFLIACLFGAPLLAETIGNVHFQFPPSIHNWVLLTDIQFPEGEEDGNLFMNMKIYTHRAGDAVEFFTAGLMADSSGGDDEDEDEDEIQTADFLQSAINEQLIGAFPNHKVIISHFQDDEESSFIEWELNDGISQIFHGLCRYLQHDEKGVVLSYMTTAAKNLENKILWTDVLNQAKVK